MNLGDLNQDSQINVADIVTLVNWILNNIYDNLVATERSKLMYIY